MVTGYLKVIISSQTCSPYLVCDLDVYILLHTPFAATVACQTSGLAATPQTRNPTKQFPRDGHPLRRPSHRSGSPGKEMDIHYVAPSKRWTSTTSPRNPDRKPPEREGHPLRRLLTPRPPPPFDFGQSDRVREPDPEIAPKFAVPGPLLRS